jgi:hypothetical protein
MNGAKEATCCEGKTDCSDAATCKGAADCTCADCAKGDAADSTLVTPTVVEDPKPTEPVH